MNTFGDKIKITVFGQSHDQAIGVVIDGLSAGFEIDIERLNKFMQRRAPGNNSYSTARKEADAPEFVSGLLDGRTTGAPLCAVIYNNDTKSKDYSELAEKMRPSHSDYPAYVKFDGKNDVRGGGMFSGRLTAPLCIAGGILMQMLEKKGVYIGAHILSVKDKMDNKFDAVCCTKEEIQAPGKKDFPVISDLAGEEMKKVIVDAKNDCDSVGGVIECVVTGMKAGIGEPMFYGLENVISSCVFAVPAVKGIEFGAGFGCANLFGSQNNDEYYYDENKNVKTRTNNAGGICGGLSTSMPIIFNTAIKPTPSIAKAQNTINVKTKKQDVLEIKGRHDPCIVQRAVPCIEAVTAIAISQFLL